eukprot:gb/GEZN01019247.1/.p1 GENE.gb/GEZN01019247.1/~~gb/GEZN01019247.1/.p1  ORF type:complete len:195 (+),score=17.30 gb/GEZN01019247.1/:63-647(+)
MHGVKLLLQSRVHLRSVRALHSGLVTPPTPLLRRCFSTTSSSRTADKKVIKAMPRAPVKLMGTSKDVLKASLENPGHSAVTIKGSCHCGAVTYEIKASDSINAIECNCSHCYIKGMANLIRKHQDFKMVKGSAKDMHVYSFGLNRADQVSCKHCATHLWIQWHGRDVINLNVKCFDQTELKEIRVFSFDGLSKL